MTSKWRFHYRDSYVIGLYRDKTTFVHLSGLAKNSPTLTRTATQLNRRAVMFKPMQGSNYSKALILVCSGLPKNKDYEKDIVSFMPTIDSM